MSMISPDLFIEFECKGKPYRELLKIREDLLEDIYEFEKDGFADETPVMEPSPDVVYQMNLEYLGELCKLISETYNKEFICRDDD